MKSGEAPDVFAYLSYRTYLQEWFTAQKAADQRYSHRLFARRAGVRSPSLLGEVIAGRRNLTAITQEGFIEAMRLSHVQATFFADLVRFDQAETTDDKRRAWDRIAASRRFRSARPIDAGMVRYLSSWYYPAVRELAWRSDFQADPAWISVRMLPKITLGQARDALATLRELNMLVEQDGRLRPQDVSLVTPHQVADMAAHNYHLQMIERARDAVTAIEPEERHLCAVTVAIPIELIPRLKAELDAFQERLLHLCDEHVADAKQVVQLNLQLIPLSRGDL
ncbi:MAG: hypothetical protein ACI8RZ_002658 [Myxococcota bacterium]|jgi:uncharacterized protein (TIGR02147 family)